MLSTDKEGCSSEGQAGSKSIREKMKGSGNKGSIRNCIIIPAYVIKQEL